MNQNFVYHMPTKIVFGEDSLNDIDKYINGRKLCLLPLRGLSKEVCLKNLKH
jgi:alcohol dehydrogenase YqhD (iron-dependent ADH family)